MFYDFIIIHFNVLNIEILFTWKRSIVECILVRYPEEVGRLFYAMFSSEDGILKPIFNLGSITELWF